MISKQDFGPTNDDYKNMIQSHEGRLEKVEILVHFLFSSCILEGEGHWCEYWSPWKEIGYANEKVGTKQSWHIGAPPNMQAG